MTIIQFILAFISAFGLGAIVQTYISQRADTKKRNFQEKKECYVGLLEAYHVAAVERTDKAGKNFAYWQMRCELVGPENVRKAIQAIVDTNEDKAARNQAHENLKSVLRADLKVTN